MRISRNITDVMAALSTFAVLLILWEMAIWYFKVPAFYVPAPTDIARVLVSNWPLYYDHLGRTLYSAVSAFVIAFTLGVSIGALVSESAFFKRTLHPVLIAVQAMPRIALAPLIVIWFGFGPASKIVMGAFAAFFPVFLNTVHGMGGVDADQIRLMQSLRASRFQMFWKLKLPNSIPFLIAAADMGIIFSLLAVIVAEFLGANRGMGFLLVSQSNQMDTAGVFANILILSVIGLAFHYVVVLVKNKLLFWSDSDTLTAN